MATTPTEPVVPKPQTIEDQKPEGNDTKVDDKETDEWAGKEDQKPEPATAEEAKDDAEKEKQAAE